MKGKVALSLRSVKINRTYDPSTFRLMWSYLARLLPVFPSHAAGASAYSKIFRWSKTATRWRSTLAGVLGRRPWLVFHSSDRYSATSPGTAQGRWVKGNWTTMASTTPLWPQRQAVKVCEERLTDAVCYAA